MKSKILSLVAVVLTLSACALKTKTHEISDVKEPKTTTAGAAKKGEKPTAELGKPVGIVVNTKDLQILEKMNKAVEAYVLKNETKSFIKLCKDKRFDCFVDDKDYPQNKKKISRSVPPYASGSKMGLQGEIRIQVRYDFYP